MLWFGRIKELEERIKESEEKIKDLNERYRRHWFDFHDDYVLLFKHKKTLKDFRDWIEQEIPKYRKSRKRKEWWRKVLRLD